MAVVLNTSGLSSVVSVLLADYKNSARTYGLSLCSSWKGTEIDPDRFPPPVKYTRCETPKRLSGGVQTIRQNSSFQNRTARSS